MATPIRISGSSKWGTCFCVEDADSKRFFTAAHVLLDCGVSGKATSAKIEMCDDQPRFYNAPEVFVITEIMWDLGCDFVEFRCDFPGQPYDIAVLPQKDSAISVHGYLFLPDTAIPDCGVANTLSGSLQDIGRREGCSRPRLYLALQTGEPELHGMSGGPVVEANTNCVTSLFNGSHRRGGGNPFVATSLHLQES